VSNCTPIRFMGGNEVLEVKAFVQYKFFPNLDLLEVYGAHMLLSSRVAGFYSA